MARASRRQGRQTVVTARHAHDRKPLRPGAAGSEPTVAEAGETLASQLSQLLAQAADARDLPVPAPTTAREALTHQGWQQPRRASTAAAARRRLADAVAADDADTAAAAWTQLARTVEDDRAAQVAELARCHGLAARRAGRAPLFAHPVRLRQRRANWELYPLAALHGITLPPSAQHTLAGWQQAGAPLAAYYLADEQPLPARQRLATPTLVSTATRAVRSAAGGLTSAGQAAGTAAGAVLALSAAPLVWLAEIDPVLLGVVSGDGQVGAWFELHRWYHP